MHTTPVSDALDGLSRTMRRCCRLFESVCAQKACCFVSPSRRMLRATTAPVASTCLQAKEEIKTEVVLEEEVKLAGTEPLSLEIAGMDCIDCLPKVDRALSRLPS